MASITSAGVGSGLDLEAIITASVDAENLPKVAQFDKKESAVNLEISGVAQIKSDLSSFQDTIDKLADIDTFTGRTATVTQPADGDVISVTSSSTATAGTFEIEVTQLAQGSRAVQADASAYSATTDVVTASGGTLTLTAGTKTFNITLSAGATLADLRNAINNDSNNFGVSANIINTGGTTPLSKLVLTSSETGSGNDLTVTGDTAELDKVTTTAFGGGAGGLAIAVADQAQDAIIKIDGITATSSSNTFTDTIQDSTITALRVDTNPATLKIDTDKEAVRSTINDFVDSFNSLMTSLDSLIDADAAETTARGLKNTIINQVGTIVSGANNLTSIYDIGISLESQSQLKVDSTAVNTLDDALTNSYDDIGTLFAGTGGVATTLAATIDSYLQSGGIIKTQEDALDLQKKSIEQDRLDHEYQMQLFEQRLREKYASLDTLIASMRSQGTALTSALSNLPGFTSSSSSS